MFLQKFGKNRSHADCYGSILVIEIKPTLSLLKFLISLVNKVEVFTIIKSE